MGLEDYAILGAAVNELESFLKGIDFNMNIIIGTGVGAAVAWISFYLLMRSRRNYKAKEHQINPINTATYDIAERTRLLNVLPGLKGARNFEVAHNIPKRLDQPNLFEVYGISKTDASRKP